MKTKITEMLGIKYPILCGGMLWLSKPELCAAISNAGGLGNITAANYDSGDELRAAIRQCRELTDKPFGVNVTLLPSLRITPEKYDAYFQVCAEEKVAAMEIGGKPATKYLPALHAAGVKVFHKVGAVRHAVNVESLGYDGVYAAGFEEGGHPLDDDVTTMVLTPRIAESVNIPVVTVGGVADGRGLAAALALGAEGVMMATRFLATTEARQVLHENFQRELIARQENETTLITKSLNLQGRALKNKLVKEILDIESEKADLERLYPLITGQRAKAAYQTGEVEEMTFMVGQTIGLIKEVKSCRELLEQMTEEAGEILRRQSARF
ncbi:MAG: nitronate monooxygenase [Gracilibacteraceae bacterium]|jgi:nitronate monooxygenase|nr:nitronate monooxygenase [Gracilibacteraceae bacterium]